MFTNSLPPWLKTYVCQSLYSSLHLLIRNSITHFGAILAYTLEPFCLLSTTRVWCVCALNYIFTERAPRCHVVSFVPRMSTVGTMHWTSFWPVVTFGHTAPKTKFATCFLMIFLTLWFTTAATCHLHVVGQHTFTLSPSPEPNSQVTNQPIQINENHLSLSNVQELKCLKHNALTFYNWRQKWVESTIEQESEDISIVAWANSLSWPAINLEHGEIQTCPESLLLEKSEQNAWHGCIQYPQRPSNRNHSRLKELMLPCVSVGDQAWSLCPWMCMSLLTDPGHRIYQENHCAD